VRTRAPALLAAVLLAACAGGPPPPDWQIEAHAALERYARHELEGNRRLAEQDFARAKSALARTGRADLLARAELTRCALRVASLEFGPCTGFEPLRVDAPAAERAYAEFLAGGRPDAALLPEAYRAFAGGGAAGAAALASIDSTRSRLIVAGVLFRTQRLAPDATAVAIETAASEGWRRPLAAWLEVEIARATRAGDTEHAARLQRRLARVLGDAAKPR